MKRLFVVSLFGLVLASLILIGGSAVAVEEPKYTLVLKEGAFEIRDYRPVAVAEVTVSGDQWSAASQGFRLLAAYIFGGNKGNRKIAMTAPVAQAPAGQKIAMTAPVTETQSDTGAWVVRFTMPAALTLDALPEPDDPRVQLRQAAATRFAVVRFSGWATASSFKAKTAELERFVQARKLQPLGPAELAQYNPPWTLWFMRRNEAMIPVAK